MRTNVMEAAVQEMYVIMMVFNSHGKCEIRRRGRSGSSVRLQDDTM